MSQSAAAADHMDCSNAGNTHNSSSDTLPHTPARFEFTLPLRPLHSLFPQLQPLSPNLFAVHSSSSDSESDSELDSAIRRVRTRQTKPSPFTVLKCNEYRYSDPDPADIELCTCQLTDNCGDSCLNRHLLTECGKECVTGAKCTNRVMQQRSYAQCKVEFVSAKKLQLLTAVAVLSSATCFV